MNNEDIKKLIEIGGVERISAREIFNLLTELTTEGKITSKTIMGKEYASINRKYADGELFATTVESIDVLDEDTQKIFENLRSGSRIMTKRDLMVKAGLNTLYMINRAVKDGGLLRFDMLGRSSILYIA